MSIRDQIEQIVNHLDSILTIVDNIHLQDDPTATIETLNKIITIPDLFNMDRLQESVIYIKDFYALD